MPLPLARLADDDAGEMLRDQLSQALAAAEAVGKALYKAGREMACWIVSPADKNKASADSVKPVPAQLRIESGYWSSLEVEFHRFLRDSPERGRRLWMPAFHRASGSAVRL